MNGLFLTLVLLAFVVMLFSTRFTLPLLTLGILLLDAGVHGNQSAPPTWLSISSVVLSAL